MSLDGVNGNGRNCFQPGGICWLNAVRRAAVAVYVAIRSTTSTRLLLPRRLSARAYVLVLSACVPASSRPTWMIAASFSGTPASGRRCRTMSIVAGSSPTAMASISWSDHSYRLIVLASGGENRELRERAPEWRGPANIGARRMQPDRRQPLDTWLDRRQSIPGIRVDIRGQGSLRQPLVLPAGAARRTGCGPTTRGQYTRARTPLRFRASLPPSGRNSYTPPKWKCEVQSSKLRRSKWA